MTPHASPEGAERRVATRVPCAICGQPATCVGAYEGAEVASFACDSCCGHGNEDGWCVQVSDAQHDILGTAAQDGERGAREKLAEGMRNLTHDEAEAFREMRHRLSEPRGERVGGEERRVAQRRQGERRNLSEGVDVQVWRAAIVDRADQQRQGTDRRIATEDRRQRVGLGPETLQEIRAIMERVGYLPSTIEGVQRILASYSIEEIKKVPRNAHDSARSPSERPAEETVERERLEWRCFHCGELFTDERRAREHFGWNESKTPACIIKGSEGGLVRALREVEREYAELLLRLGEETNEAAKAHYAYVSRQHMAVQDAEEVGYARGLADGRAPSERVQGGEAKRPHEVVPPMVRPDDERRLPTQPPAPPQSPPRGPR